MSLAISLFQRVGFPFGLFVLLPFLFYFCFNVSHFSFISHLSDLSLALSPSTQCPILLSSSLFPSPLPTSLSLCLSFSLSFSLARSLALSFLSFINPCWISFLWSFLSRCLLSNCHILFLSCQFYLCSIFSSHSLSPPFSSLNRNQLPALPCVCGVCFFSMSRFPLLYPFHFPLYYYFRSSFFSIFSCFSF